jgi:hypothetical protein
VAESGIKILKTMERASRFVVVVDIEFETQLRDFLNKI